MVLAWSQDFAHSLFSFILPTPLFLLIVLQKASLNKPILDKFCVQVTEKDSEMQLLPARSCSVKSWLSLFSGIPQVPDTFPVEGAQVRLMAERSSAAFGAMR